jgi:hypothetical protein
MSEDEDFQNGNGVDEERKKHKKDKKKKHKKDKDRKKVLLKLQLKECLFLERQNFFFKIPV